MYKPKILKIPNALSQNPCVNIIKSYLEKLSPFSGYFSYLLYKNKTNNKYYFVNKDQHFPFLPLDWTLYTMMRSYAKNMLITGVVLRQEFINFNDEMGTFGKKQLMDIYQNNMVQPCNLYVYTKKLTQDYINKTITKRYFRYVPLTTLGYQPNKRQLSFKQIAKKINQLGTGPTIYEIGRETLDKSLHQVQQFQDNYADLLVLSLMEGPLPQRYISAQYDTNILQRDFNVVWQSQPIPSNYKHEGSQKIIYFRFVVLYKKIKNNRSIK